MKTAAELKAALDFLLKKGLILEGFTNFIITRGKEYFELTEVLTEYANQSKWISVKERLPEAKDNKIKSVLVRVKNNTLVAWYFPKHFKSVEFEDWDDFDIDNYPYMEEDKENESVWLKEGWYTEYYHQDYLYQEPINVTHWQPLPEKP